jgi:hypothetical protein
MNSPMAILVNGERVPEELIAEERQRWLMAPGWDAIGDASERETLLQQCSERSAIERVLMRQEMLKDTRPIEQALVDRELQRLGGANGCRTEMTANQRASVEGTLRLAASHAGDCMSPEPPWTASNGSWAKRPWRILFLRPGAEKGKTKSRAVQ